MLLHKGKPACRYQYVVNIGLPGIRFQSRKTCDAVLIGERSIKPFPVLGRYKRGNLLQHLILERATGRSEEHTSELQSLMRISYAVFCLKKKKKHKINQQK